MGERGDQLRPLPHIPRLLHPDGVIKPPWEGERSVWAAEDPRSGRGLGEAGPGLRQRLVARVRWQDFLATWPAVWRAVSSQADTRSRLRETELSEDGAHKQSRPLRIGS